MTYIRIKPLCISFVLLLYVLLEHAWVWHITHHPLQATLKNHHLIHFHIQVENEKYLNVVFHAIRKTKPHRSQILTVFTIAQAWKGYIHNIVTLGRSGLKKPDSYIRLETVVLFWFCSCSYCMMLFCGVV